ncbi:hypothetical protein EDB85DRAFT_1969173 [Lactarius pseudohatsudake]|nr:hypothetical protein EDB85DRAFT_1969173 [Lactarius pseudohatsudake]
MSESKSKFRPSSSSCSSSSRIISLTSRSTAPAKSFKVWRVAGQAHVSASDLEDETRNRLEDVDEDEEEGESASSSNGKAVDAELELTDGVWGTPAAEGEDEAWKSSFAEDDDGGTSNDREVKRRRAVHAYECSHRINLLVHEHAPSSPSSPSSTSATPTSSRPSQRPNRPGAARPGTGPVRAAWIAPGLTSSSVSTNPSTRYGTQLTAKVQIGDGATGASLVQRDHYPPRLKKTQYKCVALYMLEGLY